MPAKLELSLLGTVAITRDGTEISEHISAKSQALLCYLAVTGCQHNREKLAGLLWGNKPDTKARVNLRKSLSNLRKVVGDALIITRQTVAFNRDSAYWLDVKLFESALAANDANTEDLQTLSEAVALYRGDFLDDLLVRQASAFEEWVLSEKVRLRQLVIQALQRLSVGYAARGEYATSIDTINQLLTLEPWQEEAHRQLMTLLARSGQRSAALAQYETCRQILAEELGVEPLPETQALYRRLKTNKESALHYLPSQTTPFIGRQTELAQIARNLDSSDCRLLTLIGAGGIGKTRLALQAAEQAADAFAHGVYFVPLAGISSPEFLESMIMEAIGYPLSGETAPKRQLFNYLQQKEILLVLDNFESLFSLPEGSDIGRGLVLEMMQTATKLKLLITSRERLNLQAEWLLTLQGLPYPEGETAVSPTSFEATDLFAQGARRVRADFNLPTEWPDVARICQLLDGMPLGIELAATWVAMMPCSEIVQELSRGLELLSTTFHDVPARHRSLEAVFDHSWKILSEPERDVFKKLSLFRGGFNLQAARQIAGASLLTLATLVNKSLLRVIRPGHYDLLEPLKQYAALRLAENDPCILSELEDCHGRYYLSFLHAREKQLQGEALSQTLAEIDRAFKDIQAAWRWAVDGKQFDLMGQVGKSLYLFCDIHSRLQTGDTLFEYAIDSLAAFAGTDNKLEHQTLGKLLACRGRLLYSRGKYQAGCTMLEKSLQIFHDGNQSDRAYPELLNKVELAEWVAFNLHSLGLLAAAQGEYQQAKQYAQESLNLCQSLKSSLKSSLNSQWDEAWALFVLGRAAYALGEYAPGWQFTQHSLTLHRQLGNRHGEAACLNILGLIICGLYEGEPDKYSEAREMFEQILAIRQTIGDRRGEATALHNLGYIQYKLGQYNQARIRFEASLKISKMIGSLNVVAATDMWMGLLHMEQENFCEAKEYLAGALEIAYENNAMTRLTDVLCRIGDLLWRTGEYAEAVTYLTFVQNHPATDDRVRLEVDELMVKLTAVLPPQTLKAAQLRGQSRPLAAFVSDVLNQPTY